MNPFVRLAGVVGAVLAAAPHAALAQRLAVRVYDTRDGLAHERVNAVVQDGKGYLWFGTWEGLSRFDGTRFVNYGTREGLPVPLVNDVAQDRRGRLWLATHGGGPALLLDDPHEPTPAGPALQPGAPGLKFATYRVDDPREAAYVLGLVWDSHDTLWCLTGAGLYRWDSARQTGVSFTRVGPFGVSDPPYGGLRDRRGRVWLAGEPDLFEAVGGELQPRGSPPAPHPGRFRAMTRAPGDALLMAYERAVLTYKPPDTPGDDGVWRRMPIELADGQSITAVLADSGGGTWIGTERGLIHRRAGVQTVYGKAEGLSDDNIRGLAEDSEGHLWVSTWLGGVCMLSGEAILSYTAAQGLPRPNVGWLAEGSDGRLYATFDECGPTEIAAGRVLPVPGSRTPPFDRLWMAIHQDRLGDWWVSSGRSLYRFEGPRLQLRRGRRFTVADGLPEAETFGAIASDPDGRPCSAFADGSVCCVGIEKGDEPRVECRTVRRSDPQMHEPRVMLADTHGGFWLAAFVGLGRIRDGTLMVFDRLEGIPESPINPRCLFQDSRGWLWVGTRFKGVSVTREPSAPRPRFVNYSSANGLESDVVWSITEDETGLIYLGTAKGLAQLDPTSGRVRHFTTEEGLAGNVVNHCLRDRRGFIWAATTGGISRLDPRALRPGGRPPVVYLSRVQVAGRDEPLPETGAARWEGVVVSHPRDALVIEYAGLGRQSGRELRYQRRLEGSDEGWSEPSEGRVVQYAGLAAGTYRFLVRAVNRDGTVGEPLASLEFRVMPPLWQRWWVVGLIAGAAAGAGLAVHRARVRRLLATERIRRQIATDLHDDIGSGLSQIAILAEVARRDARPAAEPLLGQAADLARSMRESMSDIIWAVDPRKDRLVDMLRRMRQASFNLLGADGVRVEFVAPAPDALERVGLPPDVKRHIFLIYKEALNNVARHARASSVRVTIEMRGPALRMAVQDDGIGFDAAAPPDGHGLEGLRRRGEHLGARLEIRSARGSGTTVELVVPVRGVRPDRA